jgi:hypothetical protein
LLLLPLTACGPDANSDDSGSDTGPPATTAEPTPTTGEPTPSTTGTATDSATDSASDTATDTASDTATDTTDTTTTTTEPGTTTGPVTATSTGDDDSGTTGADVLQLDPATLATFALPINSLRFAVAGHDAAHDLCVSVIFSGPSIDHQLHCDDFIPDDPYVVIEPGAGPCMNWDYAGNVELTAVSGCMQLISEDPAQIELDLVLQVSGDLFTGEIHLASP